MFGGPLTHRCLQDAVQLIARPLGLTKFPEYVSTVLISFAFFLLLHIVLAPAVSSKFCPDAFGKASRKARNNWSIHVVSQAHALLVVPLAIRCLHLPALGDDRAFGWDGRAGTVQAIACGYFLWDCLDAIVNFVSVGFVIHGLACLAVYTVAFRPFLAYYGVRCLLWEMSTLFLNIHWFLDKTGHTGSTLQLVNGVCLLLTFFGVRIVYGGVVSYEFFCTLYEVRDRVPLLTYLLGYAIGNITLQALNWYWLAKMVNSLRGRFGVSGRECEPLRGCGTNSSKVSYSSGIIGQQEK